MGERRIGIIMNGVTGRMGANQHLAACIMPLRREGGVTLANGDRLVPDPILVGRNADALQRLAARHGIDRWSTDLAAALGDPDDTVYFDATRTDMRVANLERAIAAGKDIYCEKPIALTHGDGAAIAAKAEAAGIRHGAVQDKLWSAGLRKLRTVIGSGLLGRILSVRLEAAYWVFDGSLQAPQRPSWNYRKADGGGMILDMVPHYTYMLEDLVAPVRRLVCHAATHLPERRDEAGRPYAADADDAMYAILELEGGIIGTIVSSWCVRVRRDDIITMEVHGTGGSAIAGLRTCYVQPAATTPRAQVLAGANPDFHADWQEVPTVEPEVNAYRAQWEAFLRHVADDAPFPWSLRSAARGLRLVDCSFESWRQGRWVDVAAG